ncbi:hypothetical protein GQ53DRAFT_602649, partial [Thozetella sp. PMI_491]
SIVFVHGFTGHPKDTWTWQGSEPVTEHTVDRREFVNGSEVYWPADLAPQTVPNSRILTYGYDTRVRHWLNGPVSTKSLHDHGWDLVCSLEARRRASGEFHRPILFVSHSLGGLVTQEALKRSRESASTKPHFYAVFKSTVGVLFFGTPHRGADPRNLFLKILSISAQAIGVQVNQNIVTTLVPDAQRLSQLRDAFSAMCHERNWQIYSYQEEYGLTALFRRKVVEDTSSCLDDPKIETKQHISRNHMNMCRFFGHSDPEYLKVEAAITLI